MIQIDTNMDLQEQFEFFLQEENAMHMPEFLNELNISDVGQLIEDNKEHATEIMAELSIHRAASTFKIIELVFKKTSYRSYHP
jgi:magnesium transporter